MGALGPTELLIIMAILLIIFGGSRLPPLAQALRKSMEEWQRPSPYEQQWRGEQAPFPPLPKVVTIILAMVGLFMLAYLVSEDVLSAGQALAVVLVAAGWLVAGFYCFGRKG